MTTLSMRLRNGVAGRWARLTWAWVGACAVMIGSVGCNAARLGPDDPECPTAEPCTTMGPSPTLVRVQVSPSTVTLESLNGSRPTQQFVVTGVRADGSMTGPLQAVFNAPGAGVGAVDGNSGLFTATGEVGGVVMGTATVMAGGSPRMASFQITVNVTKEILAPGAPADAGTHFMGAPTFDPAQAATIVYPLNGVVMPQNVYPADIQWTGGAANDLYRVQISKPNFTMRSYVRHSGAGFAYDYLPPGPAWSGATQSSPNSDATLTVDRWDSVGDKVYSGTPVTMTFAKGALLGSIYYWDIQAGRIRRIDDGTANAIDFMPTPPTSPTTGETCIGCHVVSRDGRYMVGRLGGGDNVGGIFDLTVSQSPTAVSTYPITAGLQKFWFSTWKPDNTRLLVSETPGGAPNSNAFYLLDTKDGSVVTPTTGPLPTLGTHPSWSPDGNRVVYVSEANSWGGDGLVSANLSVLPVTGADAFGAPQRIHTAASIAGSQVDTYPTWAPDSKWIAFHNGPDGRSDNGSDGALYLIAPDGTGLVRLTQATTGGTPGASLGKVYFPNFSPFNVGGYFWLTYVSNRPYGNSQAGTAAAPHQQLWVAAVKNSPTPGQDPSCVPYWLPGQVSASKNISAYWAPKACRLDNDTCSTGTECCSGVCTGNKCQPPPARCLQQGEMCGGSGCCAGLSCDPKTHICVNVIG